MIKLLTKILNLAALPVMCAVAPIPLRAVDIIVDNKDSSGVTLLPNPAAWSGSTALAGYYGSNYLTDQNSGQGTKSARFSPALPAAGIYEVFSRWSAYTNRADNVPIDLVTAGGVMPVQVNQKLNGGQWVSLGQYPFHAGGGGSVLISNAGANGFVIADAVKFSPATTLPTPWLQQDVGTSNPAGSAAQSGGVFTAINGSGGFHYVYQPINGNSTITAKVSSLVNPSDAWAKAGVAIRESLAANSKQAMMIVSRSNGLRFEYKTATGGTHVSTGASSGAAPYWVRVVRNGTSFTGYRSTDGVSWTQSATATISMNNTVYVGLPLYGASTATYENVTVTGGVPADLTAPSVPSGLVAAPVSSSQVNLTWNASTDTGGAGLAGYRIYRNGSSTPVGTSSANSFSDTGLSPSTAYTYQVASYDSASPSNVSALSVSAGATTAAAGSTAFFSDNFASGNMSHTENGARWGGNAYVTIADCTAFPSPLGSTKCAQFHFGQHWAELNFDMGRNVRHLFMRWYEYMPAGTESPSLGDTFGAPGNVAGSEGHNNKWLRIGNTYPEQSSTEHYGFSTQKNGGSALDNQLFAEWGGPGSYNTPGAPTFAPSIPSTNNAPYIKASNRGRWIKVEVEIKSPTIPVIADPAPGWFFGRADGIFRVWVDGVVVLQYLNAGQCPQNGVMRGGYLKGYANERYCPDGAGNPRLYLTDFALSETGRLP